MNPQAQSAAALLEPLRAPAGISWWPPAPGWWFLALLALVGVAFLLRWAWRFHRRGAPLRAARRLLAKIAADTAPVSERVAALNQLQRQLAIRMAGRAACAGLTGEAWARFLNELADNDNAPFDSSMIELAYRPDLSESQFDALLAATQSWVLKLGRPA